MVGYEPHLNPVVDWEKVPREFGRKDKPKPKPKISAAEFMRLRKNSCANRPFEPTPEVEERNYENLATPLVQVFSVCVSTDFDDGKPCEIYGSIRALEGPEPRFDLYDRDPDESETIWKDGTLSLIGPVDGAIIPSLSTTLDLCLKDRIRGVEVVKGGLSLDPVSEDSYDRLLRGVIPGVHGVVYVYYVVFQFALYATVQVIVTKTDNVDKNCNVADIYGSIVTRYENGRRYCGSDEEVKGMEIRFLDRLANRPLRVLLGTPITLSKNVVVAPAYSSLTIDLNLWDSNGKVADGCLLFPAHVYVDNQYIQTQNARVEVRVRWCHVYFYLYKDSKKNYLNRGKLIQDGEDMQKKQRVLKDKQCSTSFIPRKIPYTKSTAHLFGRCKLEVFTVCVGGITEKIYALCGTIIVDDGGEKFSIYNRDASSSELLSDNGLACIEVNYRAIQNCEFLMDLNLRDPTRNLEVSRGYLSWNVGYLEGNNMRWYEKRACTVIRGKDGFAAVHYTTFNNAFEAFVEVKLCASGDCDSPINLYGSLIASYSGYSYSTSYEKKYYRSRLFDRPRDNSVEVKARSKIDLVKSIVVLPANRSLIIEAELGAIGTNGVDELISGLKVFEIDPLSDVVETIHGEHYWIEVCLKFER